MHWLRCVLCRSLDRFLRERCHALELICLGETYLSLCDSRGCSIAVAPCSFFPFFPWYLFRQIRASRVRNDEHSYFLQFSIGENEPIFGHSKLSHPLRNDFLSDVRYGTITRRSVTRASQGSFIRWCKVANLSRHSLRRKSWFIKITRVVAY